jgi:thioredoxin-like negative regulator of GroEL
MEIEKEYQGSIIVKPIDIDENKSLADALKISSIPFLMYYKNGKLALNIEGLTDKENLVKSFGLKK